MSDVRDEIARLRYEAKRLRGYARLRREELRQLRSRPLESRDPIAELRARSRLNEYVLAAKQCDQRVTTLLRAETRSVAMRQAAIDTHPHTADAYDAQAQDA